MLVRALRQAEGEHRVIVQTLIGGNSSSTDKKTVGALAQPLESVAEIGQLPVRIEGQFLTRDGLEKFLIAGNKTGASLSALQIQDNRFKATYTLYGKL